MAQWNLMKKKELGVHGLILRAGRSASQSKCPDTEYALHRGGCFLLSPEFFCFFSDMQYIKVILTFTLTLIGTESCRNFPRLVRLVTRLRNIP